MKVLTILGTRPEIIRLSRVIEKLDRHCKHVLVHTGQNFDANLSDIFFRDLGVRQPDHYLGVRGNTFGEQIGGIITSCERVMTEEQPDRLLLLGDTNSALSAIVAKRLGIPVHHMEAGNRCYDDRVPEEVNRRVIDHSSDVLLPYTQGSKQNLLKEGIPESRIIVTGNPILEVIRHYDPSIQKSTILADLRIAKDSYFLVTMHRAENVDIEASLSHLTTALCRLQERYRVPVIVSMHPRTRSRIESFGVVMSNDDIRFLPPFGFFDFIHLESNALCVLSDSGTVQEECCILRRPNVTLRDVTERPETIECGSNVLSGVDPDRIMACVATALARPCTWTPPVEYMVDNVSEVVAGILLN